MQQSHLERYGATKTAGFSYDQMSSGNSEIKFEDERHEYLRDLGKLPVLMKAGPFQIDQKHSQADKLKAWALAFDSQLQKELSLAVRDGQVLLTVDTATLTSGPTPFFELAGK